MEKKLYYQLETAGGEGGTMELSGCMEWIKGDMEANYPYPADLEQQVEFYTLTPIWLTDAEYDALPEQ